MSLFKHRGTESTEDFLFKYKGKEHEGCLQIGFAERCFFTKSKITIKNKGLILFKKISLFLCVFVFQNN